jgi:phosphoglycerate dehydrogenase-like enzyme
VPWAARQMYGGKPRGEVMGRTPGIVGYGRIGREVASRAAGLKCRILAANRSPVAAAGPTDRIYSLAELDRMLFECDMLLIACALGPETQGLIDVRRLALMKPGAVLNYIARAPIVDEAALGFGGRQSRPHRSRRGVRECRSSDIRRLLYPARVKRRMRSTHST